MSKETLRAAETALQGQLVAEFGALQGAISGWSTGEEEAPTDLERRLRTVAGVADFGGTERAALVARGMADAWELLPADAEPGDDALPGPLVEDLAVASLGLVAEPARIITAPPAGEDLPRLRQALQALMVRWLKGEEQARQRLPGLLARIAGGDGLDEVNRRLFLLAAEVARGGRLASAQFVPLERHLGRLVQDGESAPPVELSAALLAQICPRSREAVAPDSEIRSLLKDELTQLRERLEAYHAGGGDWETVTAALPRIAATFQLRGAQELGRRLRQEGMAEPRPLADLLVAAEQVLAGGEEGEALAAVDGHAARAVASGGAVPPARLAEEGATVAAMAGEAIADGEPLPENDLAALASAATLPGWTAEAEAALALSRCAASEMETEARVAAAELAAWLEAALLARAGGEAPEPETGRAYIAALQEALPASEDPAPREVEEGPLPAAGGTDPASGETGLDPDLAAIFREEFRGIVAELGEQIARWEEDLHDETALGEVRRAFHTLKGSGRVAGAEGVGEFAWQFENLLNGLLAGSIPATPEHRALVAAAVDGLDGAMARLERGEPELDEALAQLMEQARRGAEGEAVTPPASATDTPDAATEEAGDVRSPETAEQTADPVATVDDDLIATFRRELSGHLDSLREAARQLWEAQSSIERCPPPGLERSLHTLRGNARLVGLSGLTGFLQRLEQFVTADPGRPVPPELADLLLDTADRVEEAAATLPEPPAALAGIEALEQRLSALEVIPEAAVAEGGSGHDGEASGPLPEVVAAFLEEGEEQLEALGEQLRHLEQASEQDPEQVMEAGDLQRTLHTLKGGARTAGADGLGELVHAAEELVEAMVQGRVAVVAGIGHLRAVVERVEEMTAALHQGESPAAPELVQRTRQLAAGDARAAIQAGETGAVRGGEGSHQRVRLPAAELERLAAAASEVGAQGMRLRQHLGRGRSSLEEVDRVIERVREQIRRLGLETESQIQARREELGGSSEAFDPLELDRFSNLQTLSRSLGESLSDLEALRAGLGEELRNAEADESQQRRAEQLVREGLTRARMVTFSTRLPQLRQLVQRQSAESGRQVELRTAGAELALDRSLLGRLMGPLEHLLRNAAIHGIESPEDRRAAGKPEVGGIDLAVSREGSELRLVVADDGAGLDAEAIAAAARERGLIGPEETVDAERAARLILSAGFTTRQRVDRDAGRGVGLDAVNAEVKQLGGSLEVTTTPGEGTRFRMRLSLDIALQHVLFLRAGGHVYAVPMSDVRRVSQILPERLADAESSGEWLELDGVEQALHYLHDLVGVHRPTMAGERVSVLSMAGEPPLAVVAEALEGQAEVVVRAGGPQVAALAGVTGATVLEDGRVAPLLDLRELEAVPRQVARDIRPLALIVDDSITVRRVTGRLLERQDWRVASARDGVEALEVMEEEPPAVVLLDIEMPRMDGLELLGRLRDRPDGGPPVVMITTRSGEKHRQQAESLGVNGYLGKPWQEEELLTTLAEAAHVQS
ncbi:MAG: Hpt domain-containing protein [Pseudomonadota bacterium]